MGKASVSNITVPLVSLSSQKPWLWPVSRLWLACSRSFLYAPPGCVHWHRTAPLAGSLLLTCSLAGTILLPSLWLAPYCCSPAGTLVLLTGWHPTATHRLAPYCSSTDRLTFSRLYLVVVWHCLRGYCPTPCIDVMTCETAPVVTVGPRFPCFLLSTIMHPPPQARVSRIRTGGFFCYREPAEVFGSFYLYVSMFCFLTCLGYIILGAERGRPFLSTLGV